MVNKKTIVWNYYKGTTLNNKKVARCTFCNQEFVVNATRMKRHLSKKCPKVTAVVRAKFLTGNKKKAPGNREDGAVETVSSSDSSECKDEDDDGDGTANRGDTEDIEVPTTSSTEKCDISEIAMTTRTYKTGICRWMDNCDSVTKSQLDIKFAKAIYGTASPFSMVENPLWIDFFEEIRPAWKMPSRYHLSGPLLEYWNDEIDKQNNDLISKSVGTVLMSDGWSDISNDNHIQFLLATPTPVFLKSVHSQTESHTGEYIFDISKSVIDELVIKPVAFLTDHGSNMVKAWTLLEAHYPWMLCYGCGAHSLELLAKDILKLSSFRFVHSHHKLISSAFRNRQILKQIMLEHQETLLKSNFICLQSCETRWSSAYSMMKRNNFLQDVLRISIADTRIVNDANQRAKINKLKDILCDSSTFWPLSSSCEKVLAPIRNAIKTVEGNLVKASILPRVWNYITFEIKEVLSKSDCVIPNNEKQLIFQKLSNRRDFCLRDVQKASNLLDPRFVGLDLTNDEQKAGLALICEIGRRIDLNTNQIMSDFMQFKTRSGSTYNNDLIWEAVSMTMDPTNWWAAFCEHQPLAQIAPKLLSLPATVAAVERSNKEFSLQKSKLRNRLSNRASATLTKVAYNIKAKRLINRSRKQPAHTALAYCGGPIDIDASADDESKILKFKSLFTYYW